MLKKLYNILPKNLKIDLYYLLIILFFLNFFQVVGISSILPLLSILLNDNLILENEYVFNVYQYFNFKELLDFKIFIAIVCSILVSTSSFLALFSNYKITKFEENFSLAFEKKFFNYYLYGPYNIISSKNISYSLNLITNYLPKVRDNLLSRYVNIYNQTILLIIILIPLLIFKTKIILILITTLFLYYFVFYKIFKNFFKKVGNFYNEISFVKNKLIYESLNNIKYLFFFKNKRLIYDKFSDAAKKLASAQIRVTIVGGLPRVFLEVLLFFGIVGICTYLLISNTDIINIFITLSAFAIATIRALPALNSLFSNFVGIKIGIPTFKLFDFENSKIDSFIKSNKKNKLKNKNIIQFKNYIELKNFSFKYPESNFKLDNVNLKINKGDFIGIVGESGSGKTTLVDLICGLQKPSKGNFIVDHKKININRVELFRHNIGYVPQDIYLSDASIYENITLDTLVTDKKDNKIDDIRQELILANLYDFVDSLPKKEATNVGERSTKISGGQKQRIGIARALYPKPKIIIFDESTNALDIITEKNFMKTLKSISEKGYTIIMITHKVEVLKFCNRVIEIKNGILKKIK